MKRPSPADATRKTRSGRSAQTRTVVLALIIFLLGVAGIACWFWSASKRGAAGSERLPRAKSPVTLSDSTKAILKRLNSSVEIRFYALLDPASVSDALQAFAGRVEGLLTGYEQEASGKIKVIRYDSRSDFNVAALAASADGIQPFNLDKGDACYLGIAVACNDQKESLSRIAPEWEQALESDLSRAIERVAQSKAPAQPLATASQTDPAVVEEVKRVIPNFASVSVEEGKRILTETALKDFKTTVNKMELQLRNAEQRFSQAQAGGSKAEQQAAQKQLQQIRAEQPEQLKQMAARLQIQIQALQQLKETTH